MTDTFGDFDDDDAFGTEPADPEQTARKLYELEGGRWDDLTLAQKTARIVLFAELIDWGRREGVFR